jgi:sulfur relay (sulfurtransferase) complex TusBCD TusD component (DsrE family)
MRDRYIKQAGQAECQIYRALLFVVVVCDQTARKRGVHIEETILNGLRNRDLKQGCHIQVYH